MILCTRRGDGVEHVLHRYCTCFFEDALGRQFGRKEHDGQTRAWVRGCASEIKIAILLVTILWTQIPNLSKVVTQTKRRAVDEIEALLPHFGLIHNLKLDVFPEVGCALLVGETCEYSFSRTIDHGVPILFTACIEMPH